MESYDKPWKVMISYSSLPAARVSCVCWQYSHFEFAECQCAVPCPLNDLQPAKFAHRQRLSYQIQKQDQLG